MYETQLYDGGTYIQGVEIEIIISYTIAFSFYSSFIMLINEKVFFLVSFAGGNGI